ncbi:MAG: hypothetical protein PUG60_13055 [Lachnospiraceae bacterium]|nr:hypothetical protein [Lachnospiraceae bacterium]MDY4970395.1 hypothetical protein [Lachnospiraceae bacterium]
MSGLKGCSIGIDFGSTNSSVFIFDSETGKAVPVDIVTGSPLIPSVASYNPKNRAYDYGLNAKNTSSKKVRVFKAFKMLLSEKDPMILQDRGYDPVSEDAESEETGVQANTPEYITKIFLKYILDTVLVKTGYDYIANLVVGFPEVWNNIETAGARYVLREICTGLLQGINENVSKRTGETVQSHVEIRTEPECASAFIARQIKLKSGMDYNGHVLTIDYGGGTLDITLSNIETNEKGYMEINVLARQGVGENNTEDKQIGNAGIIYMESVIEEALRRAEVYEAEESIPHNNKFYKAVNELENYITGAQREKLEDTFGFYGVDAGVLDGLGDEDDPIDWLFCTIDFDGAGDDDELLIPYSLMADCYNKVIAPTLNEQLQLIMQDMIEHGIMCKNRKIDHFKIAVVGGFGRFYPVRNQIQKFFNLDRVGDARTLEISEDEAELAIAHGACLLAEGILKIHKTSRLEIGMAQDRGKNRQIAIQYGQEIENGKIYFCEDQNHKLYKFWLDDCVREFWINYSSKESGGHIGILKRQIVRQLEGIRELKEAPVVVGFSMDESDVLTMHVQPFIKNEPAGEMMNFPLSRYDKMFDISSFV